METSAACVIRKILTVLCVIFLLPLALIGCGNKEVSFEENNTVFFNSLLARKNQDEIKIQSLTAYNLENRFYYDVVYLYNDEFVEDWTEIELIYVYALTTPELHFNIAQSEYFSSYYERYLQAVSKGVKKEFTAEQIEQYFNDFFSLADDK